MNDYQWANRAQDSIAHGALTNSKRPECFVKGVYDTHATHAKGAFIWDSTGRKLFDFICGNGSNILGFGNAIIAETIYREASRGITISLSNTMEVKLAEKIKEVIPWIERVRFLKTGSEACSAAIKIARSKTGRKRVLSGGYHGWHDEFVSLSPPALGVAEYPYIQRFIEDDSGLEQINSETAAVIIEPISTDYNPNRRMFLSRLRQKCTETGTMLIFDEVITGFRVPKFCFSSMFDIIPDIICLGKAMGNGMPISCVAGKKDVMECGEYFVSSTFAGDMCSIAASLSCIEQLQTTKFNLSELWGHGLLFQERFNKIHPEGIQIRGYPTRGVFDGDQLTKALLWQEAYKANILLGASFFFNFSHVPYIDQVLNVLTDILTRIKTGLVKLEGEMPCSPFAQRVRENK